MCATALLPPVLVVCTFAACAASPPTALHQALRVCAACVALPRLGLLVCMCATCCALPPSTYAASPVMSGT